MDRRDFLLLWLQALLLALFPGLRAAPRVAQRLAEEIGPRVAPAIFRGGIFKMSMLINGFDMPGKWKNFLRAGSAS